MADSWESTNFKPDLTDFTTPISQFGSFRVSLAADGGGVEQKPLSSVPLYTRGARIKAERGNGDILIYVGNHNVNSNNGYELGAGEELALQTNDLSIVYITASAAGGAVRVFHGK